MARCPIGQMRGPGPLALPPASGGNRARGQSGGQEDQVLGQRTNWTVSLGLHAGETGGHRTHPGEGARVTGEVRPQLGSIGNSKDFSPWVSNCVPGSWRGSKDQDRKGPSRQGSGPHPISSSSREASLYLFSISDLHTEFPWKKERVVL